MAGQNKRAVTSYDVAKAAGVSQSAVSRAFTEGAKISPATKEKVRKIAAELGYRPSFIAQSLITRRSTLIGVVVPGLVNPFYAAVLDELSQALNLMGYRVLLFSMYRDDDTTPIMEEILRHRVEAPVLVSSSLLHTLLMNASSSACRCCCSTAKTTAGRFPASPAIIWLAAPRLPISCWISAISSWHLLPVEIPLPAATGETGGFQRLRRRPPDAAR